MPVNNLDIVVFDFETGGLDPNFHEAIQVAGKAYNARTLEPYPDDEFCSLMKPLHPERLSDDALKVNGKTREQLAAAPEQSVVWLQFIEWVNRFNRGDRGGRKTKWSAPIAAGKNIRDFDLEFVKVLNDLHHPKKNDVVLFGRIKYDLEDFLAWWFENEKEPSDYKMDTIRDYFGMSRAGGHDALVDVRQTGDLIMRGLKLHRELQRRQAKDGGRFIKFKDCCKRAG